MSLQSSAWKQYRGFLWHSFLKTIFLTSGMYSYSYIGSAVVSHETSKNPPSEEDGLCFWRWGDSNPRPNVPPSDVYKLSW